jgi:hypothetical protein
LIYYISYGIKFSSWLSNGVNHYMSDELSPKEAKKIVKKFCKPPYDPEEARLKEAAWKVLEECKCGAFEWEADDEEEPLKVRKENDLAGQAAKESKGIIESVKEYGVEIVHNVQALGAAGSVAFSSATYFQSAEAIETTKEISAIIQTVEQDYGQSLGDYLFEQAATFIQKIPIINNKEATQDSEEASPQEEPDNGQADEEVKDSSQDSSQESKPAQSESGETSEKASQEVEESSEEDVEEAEEIQPEVEEAAEVKLPEVVIEEITEDEDIDSIKPHQDFPLTEIEAPIASPSGPKP